MALKQMATNQHSLWEVLLNLQNEHPRAIHAATDITGFGLLGHLDEMLRNPSLRAVLNGPKIPAIPGALHLFEKGYASSLAPANRRAWKLLDNGCVDLQMDGINRGSKEYLAMHELLVDPQTCGPLLISMDKEIAQKLTSKPQSLWTEIGSIQRR